MSNAFPHAPTVRDLPSRAAATVPAARRAGVAGRILLAVLLAAASASAGAQRHGIDLSRIDAAQVLSMGNDVLLRAPDASIDRLFQAVHASSRVPDESLALCALFEPDAARDVAAFQRTVDRLGSASRERFALAFTDIALAGLQGQPQPYDPVQARQVLKSAAVSATFLHDGFMAGLVNEGRDTAAREARCRSFRWLVGVLVDVPLAQRAAATRWLLREGLTLVSATP